MPTTAPDTEFAPRTMANYTCPSQHTFDLAFAAGITQPAEWDCPRCGKTAHPAGSTPPPPPGDHTRTHWEMLCERRSLGDLSAMLAQYAAENA